MDAFRRWGYLEAKLDPLGRLAIPPHPELRATGPEADRARKIYCGSIGIEFMHLLREERRRWIQERMESDPPLPNRRWILERLASAEVFERVLQTRYIGTKRYSLEGTTALVPLLDEILSAALDHGAEQAILGMSHRGRLNVLVHSVGKDPAEIFGEFEDVDPRSVLGGGDVKYHVGATGDYKDRKGRSLHVHLASNPSHLEAIDPVVLGRARAKQARLGKEGRRKVIPILMHGDAAFAGQGIAAEALNFADLRGFSVGGAVHIIVNNLIGFTTAPRDLHSSLFASDVAKRLSIPIMHVCGEDPDAVVRVARLAAEYRATFESDVVVDLIGYRRHGHSEVDDPTLTQPRLYQKIKNHPVLWQSYAGAAGVPTSEAEALAARIRQRFEAAQREAEKLNEHPVLREFPSYWSDFVGGPYDAAHEVETAVRPDLLHQIADGLTAAPMNFHPHPKIQALLKERAEMGQGRRPIDWGMAEALAFGSLIREGIPVRLSGQDTRRGTFNHRHAVLIDVETEEEYVPLSGQARLEVNDTTLSEAGALAYEYGYSRDAPETLVLWEAQFGDFVNGAQVIVDQFVAASEDKWGLLSGIVLLLPHGYEGQGPEHSSARIERFLQLAAEDNMEICQPSTAAQYFHLLRRQAIRKWRKPLILFTPKSLLRHPDAASSLAEFTQGRFQPVLPDPEVSEPERILLCSGKIGHELRAERKRRGTAESAIVRIERLYPFPEQEVTRELDRFAQAREVVWVQEEPANMGALGYILPRLEPLARSRPIRSVKRSQSASPATGSMKAHAIEQAALISLAFGAR